MDINNPNMAKHVGKKNILLAFDAFGTLFNPRQPIAAQYGYLARLHGMGGLREDDIQASFHKAFKEEASELPNYGKNIGMKAPEWWANVIIKTFTPLIPINTKLPEQLVPDLLHRFSSNEGYAIYPDVMPLFQHLQRLKNCRNEDKWPWQRTVVGVITNSDDRIPGILQSFGLKIGPRRFGSVHKLRASDAEEYDINFVVLSYDVGYEKPDKEIFQAADQVLKDVLIGSEVEATDFDKVFVGDEIEKDAQAASKAGWYGVLVDRQKVYASQFEEGKRLVLMADPDGSEGDSFEIIKDLSVLTDWRPWNKRRS
jgi:REG-2-like HAD superfamily hydrolase